MSFNVDHRNIPRNEKNKGNIKRKPNAAVCTKPSCLLYLHYWPYVDVASQLCDNLSSHLLPSPSHPLLDLPPLKLVSHLLRFLLLFWLCENGGDERCPRGPSRKYAVAACDNIKSSCRYIAINTRRQTHIQFRTIWHEINLKPWEGIKPQILWWEN